MAERFDLEVERWCELRTEELVSVKNTCLVFLGAVLASAGCNGDHDEHVPPAMLRAVDVFEAKAKLVAVRDGDGECVYYEVHVVLRNRHTERVVAELGYDPPNEAARLTAPALAPGVGFVIDGETSSITRSRSLGENWTAHNELAPGETRKWRFVFGVAKSQTVRIGDMSLMRVALRFYDGLDGTVVGDLFVPVSVEKGVEY
jgi:hypothetical protein